MKSTEFPFTVKLRDFGSVGIQSDNGEMEFSYEFLSFGGGFLHTSRLLS